MPPLSGGQSFAFLFRRDEGVVDRRTWWGGTLALYLALAVMALGWWQIGGWAQRPANPTPALIARTGFTYLYLFAFAASVLLIAICQYNLSAKRFRALAYPPALAGLLPLSALLAGAIHWLAPGIGPAMPGWGVAAADIALLAVLAWNILILGVRGGRGRA